MAHEQNESLPPFSPEKIDMSKLSVEELLQLKEAILARARHTVDTQNTGFNPIMMATNGGGSDTQDGEFDWWRWSEEVISLISLVSQQVSLGILTAGTAIASSGLYSSQLGSRYAGAMLGASAVFGTWFVISSVVSLARR